MRSANEWITDRLPTAADGDRDGEVQIATRDRSDYWMVNWDCIHPGTPWRHTDYWQPPAEPAPTELDRITALEQRVAALEAQLGRRAVQIIDNDSRLFALCNDGSIFQLALEEKRNYGSFWLKLPAIPQP